MLSIQYLILSSLLTGVLSAPAFIHPCKDHTKTPHSPLSNFHHGSHDKNVQDVLRSLLPHRVHVSAADPKKIVDSDVILELHPSDEQRLSDEDKKYVRHVLYRHYKTQQMKHTQTSGDSVDDPVMKKVLKEVQEREQLLAAKLEEDGEMEGSARFEAMADGEVTAGMEGEEAQKKVTDASEEQKLGEWELSQELRKRDGEGSMEAW